MLTAIDPPVSGPFLTYAEDIERPHSVLGDQSDITAGQVLSSRSIGAMHLSIPHNSLNKLVASTANNADTTWLRGHLLCRWSILLGNWNLRDFYGTNGINAKEYLESDSLNLNGFSEDL